MHQYRAHRCGDLRLENAGETTRLSGWVHRKRDHGNLLFVDLRDHYGITQIVADQADPYFAVLEETSLESVICVTGKVVARTQKTVNPAMPTGAIEVTADHVEVLSRAEPLPMPVNQDAGYPEDIRLRYRLSGFAPRICTATSFCGRKLLLPCVAI